LIAAGAVAPPASTARIGCNFVLAVVEHCFGLDYGLGRWEIGTMVVCERGNSDGACAGWWRRPSFVRDAREKKNRGNKWRRAMGE
jgi:hypothetical protein